MRMPNRPPAPGHRLRPVTTAAVWNWTSNAKRPAYLSGAADSIGYPKRNDRPAARDELRASRRAPSACPSGIRTRRRPRDLHGRADWLGTVSLRLGHGVGPSAMAASFEVSPWQTSQPFHPNENATTAVAVLFNPARVSGYDLAITWHVGGRCAAHGQDASGDLRSGRSGGKHRTAPPRAP